MSSKSLVMLGLVIGSAVGGYIPTFFGADMFSFWSILGSAIGGVLGIYVGYTLA